MADEKEKKEKNRAPEEDKSIEKILRDREKLDAQLKEKFSKVVTVMFTDIKGSTSFFETYGDIEGRLMVQKHNEMLFPCVEENGGHVIKTIGDAIMASFEDPEPAVRSAIVMQERLFEFNKSRKDKKDQIHVRIGINTGEGLVEEKDIFGDVVNVAARVESLTEPDEILVSTSVYDEVRNADDILCRYAKSTKVKGKEEAIDVYRVVWGDEEAVAGLTRSAASVAKVQRKRRENKKKLEIDISRDNETLKVTASEKSDKAQSTISSYEELKVTMAKIDEHCKDVTDILNRANTRGRVSKDILNKLRDLGQVLFDELLTVKAKEALRSAKVQDVVFIIEDSLVQIPWELLYDGEQFLCQKFNMGRIVKTKHGVVNIKQRELSRPLKMLIVSDPRGDLENSSKEGKNIRKKLDANTAFISANQKSGQVTSSYLKEKIRNFDLVHYAGHANYTPDDPSNSGWLLEGGKFTASDVMKLVGGRPMPALVFCNACQSGQTEEWKLDSSYSQEIFGLANAFLISGVQHYVGTFWEILDEPGELFAVEFYSALMEGATIGEAMRQARLFLIKEYGEDTIVWASYMLYGDPGFNYLDIEEEAYDETGEEASAGLKDASQLRSAPSDTVAFQPGAQSSNVKMAAIGAALVVILAILGLFFMNRGDRVVKADPYLQAYSFLNTDQVEKARQGFEGLSAGDPKRTEGLAAVYFETGEYEKSMAFCNKTLEAAPYNLYANVIKGHIMLAQGKTDDALKAYEKAAAIKGGVKWQKAEALNGIGRIYSSRGDAGKSLKYYGRAAQLNPASSEISTNYGFAMQKAGNAQGALSSFQNAVKAGPSDPYASAFLMQAQNEKKAVADQARQGRIDALVKDLAEGFKTGKIPVPSKDPWTSRPVAISFIDFNKKGAPAQREGEDEFFMLQISDLLQESGRVQIVEREMLDKLLAELKLSSTDLVNRDTAVRLGRILSARIIATGSIMRYKGDIQASIRLTDTETTSLKGAVREKSKDIDELANAVTGKIVEKVIKGYPLRAKILAIEENEVVLNIGTDTGVKAGMEFKILEEKKSERTGRIRYKPLGTVTVSKAENDTAYAPMPEGIKGIKEDLKLEQLVH